MATDLRFEGIGKSGEVVFSIEPGWWDLSEEQFNWVESHFNASYRDWDVDISFAEARYLHEKFKPKLVEMIQYNEQCVISYKASPGMESVVGEYEDYCTKLRSELATIDAALVNAENTISHFHLTEFEWDSGY